MFLASFENFFAFIVAHVRRSFSAKINMDEITAITKNAIEIHNALIANVAYLEFAVFKNLVVAPKIKHLVVETKHRFIIF